MEIARKLFTLDGQVSCIICGSTDNISMTHIISSALADSELFGTPRYNCDINVFSEHNFMPLCGSDGISDSCHHAIDNYQIHICYNPLQKTYHLSCSPGALERFQEKSKKELTTPPGWNPYRRLLAWRSRICGATYVFFPDFDTFEAMNKVSEESNSVGVAESDDDDENDDAVSSSSQAECRRPEESSDMSYKKRKSST